MRVLLLLPLLALSCAKNIDAPKCEELAKHVADLKVAKERVPPMGKLMAGFDGPKEVQAVYDEEHQNVVDRCARGWSSARYDCMAGAKDMDGVERCMATK